MSNSPKTIVAFLLERLHEHPAAHALWVHATGGVQSFKWQELGGLCLEFARLLEDWGVRRGDRVAQLSENRLEWIVSDLAIQMLGAIHVPLHASLTAQQSHEQIVDCGAEVLLVSTDQQRAKLLGAPLDWSGLRATYVYDTGANSVGPTATLFAEWLSKESSVTRVLDEISGRCVAIQADDIASILYTSGTTGKPKGVILSQRNLVFNTLATIQAFQEGKSEVRLNFLPLSHIFARTCDLYTWLAQGTELGLAHSKETILADCQTIRPTLINGVPYFFEKVLRGLQLEGLAEQPNALRDRLGGNIRLCNSGGAPLSPITFEYYHQHGVPLLEGYGLTETSPVISLSTLQQVRVSCVGRPISGIEVATTEEGELITRGPHVMAGYYNDAEATAEVIRDGWFYTGDLGEILDDGFLRITGRKKEILVTTGGKNVAPVAIEVLLVGIPLITQAMVVGDNRDYLTALIVPDADELRAEITKRRIRVFSVAGALRHPKVRELYRQAIEQQLSVLSHYEQICDFVLLDRGFTVETGELTAKLSLRRDVVLQKFEKQIELLYQGSN